MTELCQKEVAVPIQVRRIAFCPTPLCQLYVEIQWIAKWGMRGLFHNHLIFPPFPTAIWWEKYFFFCAVMTKLCQSGVGSAWKVRGAFFSPVSPLMTPLCQLGVEFPWKVRDTFLLSVVMSELWQKQLNCGIQGRGVNSPFTRLCCVSFMSHGQSFPLDEWGDVFSSTTE